ncbi:MAG TPA: hypothetical protein VGL53_27295 [Bryobacteraceae bacterium]|jgi:hypothetical protein
MNKQFLIFLGIGLVVAGAAVYLYQAGTSDSRLAVNGEILKVRTVELAPRNTFMIADFRLRNTSDVTFGLRDAVLFVTLANGQEKEGQTVSRPDVQNVFKFAPLAGPQYNQVLAMSDRVPGKVSIDRMVAATFTEDDAALTARKSVRLHLIDLDGKEFDLLEKKASQ